MWIRLNISLLFIAFLFVTSCGGAEGIYESLGYEDELYADAPENPDKNKLLGLVNEARKTGRYCGDEYFPPAGKVVWNELLEAAAQMHSDDMNTYDFLSHTGSDGSSPGDRLEKVGYEWTTYGENIAKGYPTEEEVIKGWLESPGHCANIMNPDFTEMGVATSGKYWTQIFATPKQ